MQRISSLKEAWEADEHLFHRQSDDAWRAGGAAGCVLSGAAVGKIFAAVCDGIGGLPDGAEASRSAVQALLTAFHKNPQAAPSYLYRQAIDWMDRAVAEQTAGGGSTIVSVWVRSGGLYWLSIGDSGLFLLRGGSLQRLVPEHNYAALLKQRLEGGEISQLLYDREIGRGRALTSYLGMNGIRLYAQNQYPLTLRRTAAGARHAGAGSAAFPARHRAAADKKAPDRAAGPQRQYAGQYHAGPDQTTPIKGDETE